MSGVRTRLFTERAELSRELTSLRLAVTQLETDLSRLNNDIATAGSLITLCTHIIMTCVCVFVFVAGVKGVSGDEVRECSRKSHLLSAHSVKCQDMISVINEFSKRIRYRIQVLRYASLNIQVT